MKSCSFGCIVQRLGRKHLIESNGFFCRADLFCCHGGAGLNHFHQKPNRQWFETDAVLQVSLANILFFTILALMMMSVKNQRDPQESIYQGG